MNERNYCVYMHKNKETNKIYIGATCLKPKLRWANGKGYKSNKIFYNDICKYGWDNFEHIILEHNLSKEKSKQKEIYYIEIYKDNIYNKTKGGEQGKITLLTDNEYQESFRKRSKKNYDTNEKYRLNKIKKQLIKQKENKIEHNKYHREYYYKNEKYHQHKIEYQRKYREKMKMNNKVELLTHNV